jgi:tRNA(Ile)-lysidine synthase
MIFYNRFENFLINELNIHSPQKILIAVSGGVDSMVLLHLMMQTKHQIAVAHVNYCLRDKESDADHEFIKNFCSMNEIQFFDTKFDTGSFTTENKIGIQEAARDFRYNWFSELTLKHQYNFIATAHHLNDLSETFLFNITRGTGISGLHGIPTRRNNIIRPLLFAKKNDLIDYALSNSIQYRNDSSNLKNNYSRNKIRNQVIPVLKEINPQLEVHINSLSNKLLFIENIYKNHIEQTWKMVSSELNGTIEIHIAKLLKLQELNHYLFEFLSPFNFNLSQTLDIASSLNDQSGKRFFSSSYHLFKDRESLFIIPAKTESEFEILLSNDIKTLNVNNALLTFEILAPVKDITFCQNVFYFDIATFEFPLKIRNWHIADKFIPLGMDHHKKISDFFIDEKLNLIQKKESIILCSTDESIIGVLPHRISNKNKLTKQTNTVLKITYTRV